MLGLATIIVIVLLAILGDSDAAYRQNLKLGFTNAPPGNGFLLGTDALGRDVLARTLVGGRISLLVALVSVAIATLIGTAVGVFSGYLGGKVDMVLMRFVDIVLSFPQIVILLLLAALVGTRAGHARRDHRGCHLVTWRTDRPGPGPQPCVNRRSSRRPGSSAYRTAR